VQLADRHHTLSKGVLFHNIAVSFTPGIAGGFLYTKELWAIFQIAHIGIIYLCNVFILLVRWHKKFHRKQRFSGVFVAAP
jgi:hypothetical protein